MKNTNRFLLAALSILMVLAACKKEPPLPFFKTGYQPTLLLSDTSIRPIATDSNAYWLKMKWNNPEFATPLSNAKFITQIDYVGGNFSRPLSSTVLGSFGDSFQNKVLNNWVLANGTQFGAFANLQMRLVASYSNNNDQKISNAIPFRFRAYKIPPKVALPSTRKLFLVGSATQGGWGNPVPVPTQEFSQLDETTWGGVFKLNGGSQYLALPENGSWSNKYSVANNSIVGLEKGGDFGFNLNDNFPGPIADGLYKIIFDFQIGKFTVEPFTMELGLPSKLVVVGGSTPWGWNNSVDNPQKLTQLNSGEWQINSILLKPVEGYLLIPVPGSWDQKYGVPDNSIPSARFGGPIKPQGSDFRPPFAEGNYRINVNFVTGQYKVVLN